jgi:D-beta-D-heptose 7-phosphate kinase/D-beta-D-heptose 1-phosphate adenosyltransferase
MEPYLLKIKDILTIKEETGRLKAAGKTVVFTNGCFDMLHPGHSRYLSAAKGLGDYLVVAVNTDRSVRAIKGPNRPIILEKERAEMVAALGCVDAVTLFDKDDPLDVIEAIIPSILVKGGDWAEDQIIGAGIVKEAGGMVKRIPFISGYSTSAIIRKIEKGSG